MTSIIKNWASWQKLEEEPKTESKICKDCGEKFELTLRDLEYFEMKGYKLPKRCKSCRQKKKQRMELVSENCCAGVDL